MDRKRKFLIAFIAVSLVFTIGDYFLAKRMSYNKYKSGDYFFREKASTVASSTDDWWTPEAQSRDYSDTQNLLEYTNNATVYAYNFHDPYCTIIYGDNVIEDYPVARLKFENEDLRDFYGTEKYSYSEYIKIIDGLSKSELKSDRVSTVKMADYKSVGQTIKILVIFDLCLAVLIVIFAWREMDAAITWLLYGGVAYSILFNIGMFIF